jgi:hypothetical protein
VGEPVEKRCSRCGETKPVGAFYRNSKTRDGRQSWCTECNLASAKAWQAKKRAEMGEEAWSARNREMSARRLSDLGVRARKNRASRARREALDELARRHSDEFAGLLAERRLSMGLAPPGGVGPVPFGGSLSD